MSEGDFETARQRFLAGNAAFAQGRYPEAEAEFLASLQALPGRASTLSNLGAVRLRLGRPAEALEPLQQALAVQPGDAQAWHHLGLALSATGRDAQALEAYDQALAHGADEALLHYRRGLALAALERMEEAATAWEHALARDERCVAAWVDLGTLLRDRGEHGRARECLERARALGADDPVLHFQLAALAAPAAPAESQPVPPAPPRLYVERLFDRYAQDFDQHVVDGLGYDTPQRISLGLARRHPRRFTAALDLGCGTGLCAQALRGQVDRIDGVDLSAAMLEKARALGRYDRLVHADLVDHLRVTERRYALVVAADVCIYVGALEALFEGVRRVLEPGGVFCCSVEVWDEASAAGGDATPGYVLRPTLRYAHSEAYLHALARRNGMVVSEAERHPLRQDLDGVITGLCMWMQRTDGATDGATDARPQDGAG